MTARVAALHLTPVKSLRLVGRERLHVGPHGVLENRRFFLVDADGVLVNATRLGALQTVVADYDHDARRLELHFPDGRTIAGPVTAGAQLEAGFHGHAAPAQLVEGPWSEALSAHVGTPLRLVESGLAVGAVDRGEDGTVSLISRATLARVAAAGALERPLDARRFRMLFEVDGVGPHEEDGWLERPLRVGEAVIVLRGHTGRCVITTRNPETGDSDVPTLKLLGRYRRDAATTERLGCGVHGDVLEPGEVRVGDRVELA